MDKTVESPEAPTLPIWECELLPQSKEPFTVGEIKTLKCTGFDFVEPGSDYSLKLDEKAENVFKILSVKSDGQSLKEFEVTSYSVVRGDLKIILERSGEEVFQALVKGLNMKSSVLNPQKPKAVTPAGGFYILPSGTQAVAMGAVVLSLFAIMIMRAFAKAKKLRNFRRVVSKSRYADPFMDLNIELRDYSHERKPSVMFLDTLDDSIKKFFYRVFDESVSFDNLPLLIKKLKGAGLEPHEIRSFYVLEEEYKKFRALYTEERGNVFDEKKDFLDLARKTISKTKPYIEREMQ